MKVRVSTLQIRILQGCYKLQSRKYSGDWQIQTPILYIVIARGSPTSPPDAGHKLPCNKLKITEQED